MWFISNAFGSLGAKFLFVVVFAAAAVIILARARQAGAEFVAGCRRLWAVLGRVWAVLGGIFRKIHQTEEMGTGRATEIEISDEANEQEADEKKGWNESKRERKKEN